MTKAQFLPEYKTLSKGVDHGQVKEVAPSRGTIQNSWRGKYQMLSAWLPLEDLPKFWDSWISLGAGVRWAQHCAGQSLHSW